MFTPKTRLFILIGCMIAMTYCLSVGKIYPAIVAAIFMFFTIIGYFLQGTVYQAFRQLRSGQVKKAEQTLALTTRPNWLTKTQKGYYYFVLGFVEMANNNLEESKAAYSTALKIGLRLKNDTAMVYANLASIHHKQKNKVKAREYIQLAKNIKIKGPVIAELDRIENMIG
jgi:Flp pilus assembly protein TadD